MTLCRRGRSVFVLTLVRGLATVSGITAVPPDACSAAPAVYRFPRLSGTGCLAMASLQRRNRAQPCDDVGDISRLQSGIEAIGHRRLERLPVAPNALRDGVADFRIAPAANSGSRVRGDVGGDTVGRSGRRSF